MATNVVNTSDVDIFGSLDLKSLLVVISCCYAVIRLVYYVKKWRHRYLLLEALPTKDPSSFWLYHFKDIISCKLLEQGKDYGYYKGTIKTNFSYLCSMCEEMYHRKRHGGFRLSLFSPSRLPFLSRSFFFAIDYELVQQIVSHPDLQSKGPTYDESKALVENSVLVARDDDWKRMRKLTAKAFSNTILKNVHEKTCDILNEKVFPFFDRKEHIDNEYLDMADLLTQLTLDIVGITSFSYNFGGIDAFISKTCDSDGKTNSSEESLSQLFCELKEDIITFKRYRFKPIRLNRATRKIDDIIKVVIDKRLQQHQNEDNKGNEIVKNDLLDYLCEKDVDGIPILSKEEILGNTKAFTFAGHDTTSAAMAAMFFELSRCPDIVKKIREEIDPLFDGDRFPSYIDLRVKCKYVNIVIQEVLRLYSPVMISRMSKDNDVQLKTSKYKYVIPKGTEIFMAPILTQRYYCNNNTNTEVGEIFGEEGKQYDIKEQKFDSFDPDRVVDYKNEPFFPFALGVRSCVGREMAMTELRVALAQILYNYDLVLRPEDKERSFVGLQLTLFMPYYGIKMVKRRDKKEIFEQKKVK